AKLVGDFAFAVWDTAAQRLLLARDFLGQRPLFYHHGRGFFAFASMPKGLHALAEIPYGPDEQAGAEFLVLMPQQTTRSFFKTIARVPLGHVVTVTRDSVSSRCFWLIRLWREAAHLVDKAGVSPRGALILIFGPLLPIWLWRWVQRRVGRPIA